MTLEKNETSVRMSFDISKSLRREIKVSAADNDLTISKLIEDGIRLKLAELASKKAAGK